MDSYIICQYKNITSILLTTVNDPKMLPNTIDKLQRLLKTMEYGKDVDLK